MANGEKKDDPCDDWSKHPIPKSEEKEIESEQ